MLSVNYGTKANYTALSTKSADALYFCTDTFELYKGTDSYTKAVRVVDGAELPSNKIQGVVYILNTGEACYWDGSQKQTLGLPKTTSISNASTDNEVSTGKAVYDFVSGSYAPLASPTFTGTPAAPTAASGTNTTQIATTAFVQAAIGAIPSAFHFKGVVATVTALSDIVSPAEGDVYQVTATGGEYVYVLQGDPAVGSWIELGTVVDLSGYAPLDSPAFTGTPTAPTAAAGTNTTQIATTAFVTNALTWQSIPEPTT